MKANFEELEQLHFSAAQKDSLIRRLTADTTPKRLPYRVVVALVAAASLLIGAAGAVTLAGISPEFRAMFGITTQAEEERLGSVPLDLIFQDKNGSGASITVRELVRDQERLFLLADFTAPEGTVLPQPERPYPNAPGYWIDGSDGLVAGEKVLDWDLFQDKDCTQRTFVQSLGLSCQALEDADPADNMIPLLIYMDTDRGFPPESNYLRLSNIFYLRTHQNGREVSVIEDLDIEMILPISSPTPTYQFSGRAPVKLGNTTMAVAENLVLSPLSLSMDLILADGQTYDRMLEELGGIPAYVLLKDGGHVALQFHQSYGVLDWYYTQDGELEMSGEQFFRADHVYFTPEHPLELSQIKDIVFVGDNDPGKAARNEIVHFQFQYTTFFNHTYWNDVNPR